MTINRCTRRQQGICLVKYVARCSHFQTDWTPTNWNIIHNYLMSAKNVANIVLSRNTTHSTLKVCRVEKGGCQMWKFGKEVHNRQILKSHLEQVHDGNTLLCVMSVKICSSLKKFYSTTKKCTGESVKSYASSVVTQATPPTTWIITSSKFTSSAKESNKDD